MQPVVSSNGIIIYHNVDGTAGTLDAVVEVGSIMDDSINTSGDAITV